MSASKVYVLTAGEYSDFHIVGVFSTEEMAERGLAILKQAKEWGVDSANVEEWEVDELVTRKQQGFQVWRVEMKRDGTVMSVAACPEKVAPWMDGQFYLRRGRSPCWAGECWAKRAEEAVKIANDQRAAFIAAGKWDA